MGFKAFLMIFGVIIFLVDMRNTEGSPILDNQAIPTTMGNNANNNGKFVKPIDRVIVNVLEAFMRYLKATALNNTQIILD